MTNLTNNLTLEQVEVSDIPARSNTARGHGKYFSLITDFLNTGDQAALVRFDGDVKASTVAAYMKKLIDREGWNVSVISRQGQIYLVRV